MPIHGEVAEHDMLIIRIDTTPQTIDTAIVDQDTRVWDCRGVRRRKRKAMLHFEKVRTVR